MKTMVYKEESVAAKIMRGIDECRTHLRLNNLFSCIVGFREVLEILINSPDIPEKQKNRTIPALNEFQQILTGSDQFKNLYGSVAFRDNDFRTSYEFIGQLIKIKEEEIAGVLVDKDIEQFLNLGALSEDARQKTMMMISLVERGEQTTLRQMAYENDDLAALVLTYYNDSGINSRASGDINRAIQEYKKALFISPDDEHLFYNLARAYIETGDRKNAEENIRQAIDINPDFKEGLKLQNYINKW